MAEEKKEPAKKEEAQPKVEKPEEKKSSGLSTGLIVGCCIGGIILFLLILGIAGCAYFSIAKPGIGGPNSEVPAGEPNF